MRLDRFRGFAALTHGYSHGAAPRRGPARWRSADYPTAPAAPPFFQDNWRNSIAWGLLPSVSAGPAFEAGRGAQKDVKNDECERPGGDPDGEADGTRDGEMQTGQRGEAERVAGP